MDDEPPQGWKEWLRANRKRQFAAQHSGGVPSCEFPHETPVGAVGPNWDGSGWACREHWRPNPGGHQITAIEAP